MENKKFNGFVSEEQYEAVKKAVNDAVVYSSDLDNEIEVSLDSCEFSYSIDVDFQDGLKLSIMDDASIQDIECDYAFNMFEVEMIQDIYENVEGILAVCEQYQPKEVNA